MHMTQPGLSEPGVAAAPAPIKKNSNAKIHIKRSRFISVPHDSQKKSRVGGHLFGGVGAGKSLNRGLPEQKRDSPVG